MSLYQYTAKDHNGNKLEGVLEASSASEAAELLHKKDLIIISINEEKARAVKAKDKKVKLDDLVVFSRQLATLIDAGIPLVQALGILIEQLDNKNLKQVTTLVHNDIESGMSFCDALSKHPQVFSELFVNMSRAGEASGMLEEVLDRLATYLEKVASLTRKVRSSLVYPIVVIVMALAITALLLLKVVPTFKGIFEILGGKLPLPTRILIGISDLLRIYFLPLVALFVVLGILFKKYINTGKGRYNFDKQCLKVPVLGSLLRKVAIAKFSRTFSTLVKSGVSVLNALEIAGNTAGNKIVEEAVNNSRIAVRRGELISQPLAKSGIFPPMVCRMIGVGERTGQLEKMLSKIADFYDEQIDAAVAALTSLIEPMVIAFLGVIIGGIVISLFMPIFKITELIAK